MRIYSRKRPECQEIEGAQDLCRLCLQLPEEAVPIFDENTDNICAAISLRIMICVGLEISREDCLSNIICLNCFNELNRYYTFRKRCEVSYQKLKAHIQAVKEKQYLYKELERKRQQDEFKKKSEIDTVKNTQDAMLVTLDTVQCSEVSVNIHKSRNEAITENIEVKEMSVVNDQNCEIQHESEQPSNADISTFLSTILVQLGVLTQQDNDLVYLDPGFDTLELVTGEDNMVTLHLEEEDEQAEDQEDSSDNKQFGIEIPVFNNAVRHDATSVTSINEMNHHQQIKAKSTGGVRVEKREGPVGVVGVWCATCGKSFASRATLRRHARVHSGERPYACATCARTFAQREVLARHALVHLETRPFKCSRCDKSFTQRAALSAHARAHSAPRALHLHRCALCPKMFLYASGLSRHMATHSGREYACGACARRFKDKSSLLRHLHNAKHHAHVHTHTHAPPPPATTTAAAAAPHLITTTPGV